MRILQVLEYRERGDEQQLAAVIEHDLSSHGFAMRTGYLYPHPRLSIFARLVAVLRMARRIWRRDFDALIAYQPLASVLVAVVGRLAGCRLRIVHQTCPPMELPRLVRLLDILAGSLGFYSANIVSSTAVWSEFARYPSRYRRAMVMIEHGLDAPVSTRSRETARRIFNLPLSQPVILNVGRLTAPKNQELLIRSLACLPETHLVLAGTGPYRDALHGLAATLGVDDRLHLFGALAADDIADLYAAVDLFALPSTWETLGCAALEAAMAGLPLVVSDLPALREMLRVDGVQPVAFVAARDTERWISVLGYALGAAPAPRVTAAFGRAIGRKHSRQRMIESYLSLFDAHRERGATAPADDAKGSPLLQRS